MCVCLKYRGSVGRWPHFHPSTTAPGFLCTVHRHRLNSGKETPSPSRLLFSINNNNSYPLVHYYTKSVGVVSCRRRWIVVLQTIFFKIVSSSVTTAILYYCNLLFLCMKSGEISRRRWRYRNIIKNSITIRPQHIQELTAHATTAPTTKKCRLLCFNHLLLLFPVLKRTHNSTHSLSKDDRFLSWAVLGFHSILHINMTPTYYSATRCRRSSSSSPKRNLIIIALFRANVIGIEFPTERLERQPKIGGNHECTSARRAWLLWWIIL